MKKSRLFGVLLSLALALALLSGLSAAAYANKPPHTHTIGEGDSAETIEFEPWDNTTSLPDTAGNYYLKDDVELSETWNVPEGETNLCLDGHSITSEASDDVIYVEGCTLNLFDEEGDPGTITHTKGVEGCGVYLNGGTFNMHGGSISNNTSDYYGGVFLKSGIFNMYGGKISGNTAAYGGGVTSDSSGVTFNMYGGSIENTKGSGVFVDYFCKFNMYGGKISGNTTSNGGGVFVDGSDGDGGTFNMYGGEISGNTAEYGGGVYGGPYAQFNMTGGEISGNTAEYYGGGVYENYSFEFTMSADTDTGGKISENVAGEAGGGVYLYGAGAVFTLTNGEISGNVVTNTSTKDYDGAPDSGGGVYFYDNNWSAFNLSGNPIIRGNKLGTGDNAVDSNVYLNDGTVITLTGALTNTTPIGVTSYDTNADFTSGWSTKMSGATPTAYFASDASSYTVVMSENNELQLAEKTEFSVYPDHNMTRGSVAFTVSDDTGSPVALEPGTPVGNGTVVTVTVNPSAGCVLQDIWAVKGNNERFDLDKSNDPNVYTFTMPQGDVTVYAEFIQPVSFLNWNETTKKLEDAYCWNYSEIMGSLNSVTWGADDVESWYVVSGTKNILSDVTVKGDVHLILRDGAALTVKDAISGSGSLTVYAQSDGENRGSLTANGSIGVGSVTLNGGTVTATGNNSGISTDYYGNIVINGGKVTATGNEAVKGLSVIINGGSVTAEGTACGIKSTSTSVEINGGEVTATGTETAIATPYGTVKNAVYGLGWTDAAGSEGQALIRISAEGQTLAYKKVVFPYEHTHSFAYTASGAVITATCSAPGCTLEEHDGQYAVTLTIVAPTLTTYGEAGKSELATLDGLEEFNAATGLAVEETSVAYYAARKSGDAYTKGKELSAAPTDAGVYLAEIMVGVGDAQSVSASVGYIIKPVKVSPDFIVPSGVQIIGENAFEGASMESVRIPNGCTAIGAGAFKDCANLEQISIPNSCTTIGAGAFDGCGTVFIFAPTGSEAESYCRTSTDCVFIAEDYR